MTNSYGRQTSYYNLRIFSLASSANQVRTPLVSRRTSNARSWYKNRTIRIHERVIDYTSGDRRRRRRRQAKKRRGRKKTGGKGEQNAGVGTELSNGCEYIAVINFAKTRKGEERTSRGLLGRPVSRQSGLRARFLREQGGTTKKSRRKAVERERGEEITFPVRTPDGHVSPGSANRLAAFVEGLKQPYDQWSSTPRERSSDGSIESCNPRSTVTPGTRRQRTIHVVS